MVREPSDGGAGEGGRVKTKVERLVERLRSEGYAIPKTYVFTRHYPGHWQRIAGAWLWSIRWKRIGEIGSPDSVTDLLKVKEKFRRGPFNEIYGA